MLAYALTLFFGAFLLFLVEPLIGKYILPWHGGTPAVWTTCMLVFQVLLLGGYAYAHLLSSRLRPRSQALVHGVLLLLALACLPITPAESWKPTGALPPSLHIILLLLSSVGLPFLVLSATGPLMQAWLGTTHPGCSPYRLYALSNAGSLLALLFYPFCMEWLLGRTQQTTVWSIAYLIFAGSCGLCAWRLWKSYPGTVAATHPGNGDTAAGADPSSTAKLNKYHVAAWFLLPALASSLLLSATNVLCQDVAVVPFLWVLPLAIYLLSFILSFAGERWYSRALFGSGFAGSTVLALWALNAGADAALGLQLAIYSITLFFGCMVSHGELYLLRPSLRHLTFYYLAIAAGGGLGGVFVALLAPLLFTGYTEWSWSLGTCFFVFSCICLVDKSRLDLRGWRVFGSLLSAALLLGLCKAALLTQEARVSDLDTGMAQQLFILLGETLIPYRYTGAALICLLAVWVILRQYGRSLVAWHLTCATLLFITFNVASCFMLRETKLNQGDGVERSRNFYGVLTLHEVWKGDPKGHALILRHGRITHGTQFQAPEYRKIPTTYYTERSGVALMLRALSEKGPLKVGLVGLGAGTLAAYGRHGDQYHFYEINPEVVRLARERFSYLSGSGAATEITLGDARLSLENEPSQGFDLLALDAFSSDAIPIHLLTKEAFEIYLRHLRPGGVLAVHVSNRFMDLVPVVSKLQKHFGLRSVKVTHFTHPEKPWDFGSDWILLSADSHAFDAEIIQEQADPEPDEMKDVPLWTDDYSSIFPLLR